MSSVKVVPGPAHFQAYWSASTEDLENPTHWLIKLVVATGMEVVANGLVGWAAWAEGAAGL